MVKIEESASKMRSSKRKLIVENSRAVISANADKNVPRLTDNTPFMRIGNGLRELLHALRLKGVVSYTYADNDPESLLKGTTKLVVRDTHQVPLVLQTLRRLFIKKNAVWALKTRNQ